MSNPFQGLNVLSREDNDRLFIQLRKSGNTNEAIRQAIIQGNMRLVFRYARRSKWRAARNNLTFEDIVQEGAIGLITAISGFDETRGISFTTYAERFISGAMFQAIDSFQSRNSGRISSQRNQALARLSQIIQTLRQELERYPTPYEVFQVSDSSLAETGALLRLYHSKNESLNATPKSGYATLEEMISISNPSPEDIAAARELVVKLNKLVLQILEVISDFKVLKSKDPAKEKSNRVARDRKQHLVKMWLHIGGVEQSTFTELANRWESTRANLQQQQVAGLNSITKAIGFSRHEIEVLLVIQERLQEFVSDY